MESIKTEKDLLPDILSERKNWESHIQHSKQYILKAAENKDRGLCVILGSGWWLDLPYQELSGIFKKLIFVDITHPNQIVHKAKKIPNIELFETDISGALVSVKKVYKGKEFFFDKNSLLFENNTFGLADNLKPDFVVSLNILNQLSYFPKNYLISNKIVKEEKVKQIVKKIEEHHINSLPLNKSCLITDYIQYEYDSKNELINETKRLVADLPKNSSREEWFWDFDLSGNFINNRKVKFKVAALQF